MQVMKCICIALELMRDNVIRVLMNKVLELGMNIHKEISFEPQEVTLNKATRNVECAVIKEQD